MTNPRPDTASGIIRTISHDFKEPLRSVRWYLQKLQTASDLGPTQFVAIRQLDEVVELTQKDFQRFYEAYRDNKIPLPEFRTAIRRTLGNNMRFIESNWHRLYPAIQGARFADPKLAAFPNISVSHLNDTVRRIVRRYEALLRYLDVRSAPVRIALGLHNEIVKVIGDLKGLISSEGLEDLSFDMAGTLTSKFDQTLMSLVFQNLIVNSIKYRCRDRRLQIEVMMSPVEIREIADLLPAGPAAQRLLKRGGMIGAVIYADNGSGIPAVFAESAFQPFVQVNPTDASGGSGIGLAVVRSAVESHDGAVWLKSRVGIGTTFFLLFPIDETLGARDFRAGEIRSWFGVEGGIG